MEEQTKLQRWSNAMIKRRHTMSEGKCTLEQESMMMLTLKYSEMLVKSTALRKRAMVSWLHFLIGLRSPHMRGRRSIMKWITTSMGTL